MTPAFVHFCLELATAIALGTLAGLYQHRGTAAALLAGSPWLLMWGLWVSTVLTLIHAGGAATGFAVQGLGPDETWLALSWSYIGVAIPASVILASSPWSRRWWSSPRPAGLSIASALLFLISVIMVTAPTVQITWLVPRAVDLGVGALYVVAGWLAQARPYVSSYVSPSILWFAALAYLTIAFSVRVYDPMFFAAHILRLATMVYWATWTRRIDWYLGGAR